MEQQQVGPVAVSIALAQLLLARRVAVGGQSWRKWSRPVPYHIVAGNGVGNANLGALGQRENGQQVPQPPIQQSSNDCILTYSFPETDDICSTVIRKLSIYYWRFAIEWVDKMFSSLTVKGSWCTQTKSNTFVPNSVSQSQDGKVGPVCFYDFKKLVQFNPVVNSKLGP
jgi:hypothetical protein